MRASLRWSGDEHVVAVLGDAVDLPTVLRVVDASQRLWRSDLSPVIVEMVPTWCSILVHVDPALISPTELSTSLHAFLADLPESGAVRLESRLVTLPVLYGGPAGPDIRLVAEANGVSTEEAVRRLAEGTHFVGMISFTPGQANCMWLEAELALTAPKYATPRTYTPEGTVGLGGSSVALYSVPSPGGFQMVGRMPVPVYSPYPILPAFEGSPILLRVGDRLRLESVDVERYDDIAQEVREGRYAFQIQEGELELSLPTAGVPHASPRGP